MERVWSLVVAEILLFLVVVGIVIAFFVKSILSKEGRATVLWSAHIPWLVEKNGENQLIFSTIIPIKNETQIDFTLVDVFARLQLPEEQYTDGFWQVWCRKAETNRVDGYWEAHIVPRRTDTAVELFLTLDATKTVDMAMTNLPDFSVDLYWQIVCRNPLRVRWQRLAISSERLRETWQRGENKA